MSRAVQAANECHVGLLQLAPACLGRRAWVWVVIRIVLDAVRKYKNVETQSLVSVSADTRAEPIGIYTHFRQAARNEANSGCNALARVLVGMLTRMLSPLWMGIVLPAVAFGVGVELDDGHARALRVRELPG